MYLHTGISRLRAEELLLAAKDDGSFLIRDSESLPGAYVLCLLWQSRVHQYRILTQKDGSLSVQSEGKVQPVKYKDISELVQGYLQRAEQNGLVGPLKKPVLPEKPEAIEIESDDDDLEYVNDISHNDDSSVANGSTAPCEKYFTRSFKYSYLSSFARLDLSCCDGAFVDVLKKYIDSGLEKDAIRSQQGDEEMLEFQQLLQVAGQGLQRELDGFLLKLSMCYDILTQDDADVDGEQITRQAMNDSATSYISFITEKLAHCKAQILKVEKQAHEAVKTVPDESYCYLDSHELQGIRDELQNQQSFISPSPCSSMHIPLATFEVKVTKPGKLASKMTLTIDLKQGRMYAVKPSKDFLDSSTNINHDKILQLIKSTVDNCRLDIMIKDKKKTTYHFENAHARENFCLQIRQMKNIHSTEAEVDQISVFIGTWNMGSSSPDSNLKQWLRCGGDGKCHDNVMSKIPHDFYVIGTQESGLNEKDWVNMLKATLKANLNVDVDLLESCSLWGLRLVILINPMHKHMVSHIQKSSVKTGIANTLGNKGATAISFLFNGTSFCFINAHLTSGEERLTRRNNNFRDILKGLSMGVKNLEGFDVTHKFHHVFFFGDLNYRLMDEIDVILKKADEKDIPYLLEKDQLRKSQFNKNAFHAFSESEITFLPTYRLHRRTQGYQYDWKKIKKTGTKALLAIIDDVRSPLHFLDGLSFPLRFSEDERINVPSWCDRVLWHSFPGTFIENHAYGTSNNLLNSDHRPVFASFTIGIASQFVQNRASVIENSTVKIIFHRVEAQVKTCNKQNFVLEFYSNCLPNIICCKSNSMFAEDRNTSFCCPVWVDDNLPVLKPLFNSREFLEEQHILVAVRSSGDDDESYGECIISLKNMFSREFQKFDSVLTHNGEETGKMKGEMRVSLGGKYKVGKYRKTYEVVTLDTEYQDPEEFLPGAPRVISKADSSSFCLPPVYENTQNIQTSSASSPAPPPRNLHSKFSSGGQASGMTSSSVMTASDHQLNITSSPSNGLTSKQTAPRRAKPIMGQSVLQASQRQVMPVSTSSGTSSIRASESAPGGFSACGSVASAVARQGQNHKQKDKESNVPPPLPKKQRPPTSDMNYEGLYKPSTVQEWLVGIGLDELYSVFVKHGWDDVSQLSRLTAYDLLRMGIQNTEQRNRIVISLQDF